MPDPGSTAILFVPGSWHNPNCFDPVIKLLQEQGYTTAKAPLASVGAPQPLPGFDKDVEGIKKGIEELADAGKNVVVMAHSYGGVPASEAIKDSDIATRERQGKKGGVVHLFYCCSFIIPGGKSLLEAMGGSGPPWWDVNAEETIINPKTPLVQFYNDLSEADGQAAAAQLKPQSYQCYNSILTFAAWKVVPSTYLYCLKDQAIPIDVQRTMVNETAKGVDIRTEELDSSHSPFFSMPQETADAIHRAARL